VFKNLLEEMSSSNYDTARNYIKKKFIDLKTKITSNFKEGYLKKDIIIINVKILIDRILYLIVRNMS